MTLSSATYGSPTPESRHHESCATRGKLCEACDGTGERDYPIPSPDPESVVDYGTETLECDEPGCRGGLIYGECDCQ